MSIARETSSLFSSVARERGRDVFHHRAINIVRGDAWAMTASTLGSTEYLIDLVRNNANHITARCTCTNSPGVSCAVTSGPRCCSPRRRIC